MTRHPVIAVEMITCGCIVVSLNGLIAVAVGVDSEETKSMGRAPSKLIPGRIDGSTAVVSARPNITSDTLVFNN